MKKYIFLLFLLWWDAFSFSADKKPEYKWFAARDFSLIIPFSQKISIDDTKDNKNINAFGISFMGIGNEKISRAGGLRIQSFKIDSSTTGKNTFYFFEFIFGVKYIRPITYKKPIRPTFSVIGSLGMSSSGNFFIVPELSAGIIYSKDFYTETPKGSILELFYRPLEIDISDIGNNKKGTLKPVLGLKLGYIFEGFWKL